MFGRTRVISGGVGAALPAARRCAVLPILDLHRARFGAFSNGGVGAALPAARRCAVLPIFDLHRARFGAFSTPLMNTPRPLFSIRIRMDIGSSSERTEHSRGGHPCSLRPRRRERSADAPPFLKALCTHRISRSCPRPPTFSPFSPAPPPPPRLPAPRQTHTHSRPRGRSIQLHMRMQHSEWAPSQSRGVHPQRMRVAREYSVSVLLTDAPLRRRRPPVDTAVGRRHVLGRR